MWRFGRLLLAFAGFIPLALLASSFFLGACITLFDPLAGASGNIARENPPSIWLRLFVAVTYCGLSFVFFFLAALVAKYGLSFSRSTDQAANRTSSEHSGPQPPDAPAPR